MTVIIKSDMKATRNMGNLSGVTIGDYSLLLDFNLGIYHKKTGAVKTPLTLAESIDFSRAEKGTYLTPTNGLKTAEIDVPRISYDPRTGMKGLLLEAERNELLINTLSPATQAVVIPADSFRFTLNVKGSGSAKLTGESITSGKVVLVEGSPAIATEGSPTIYAAVDREEANVVVTVTGQLEAFSMTVGTSAWSYDAKMFTPMGVTRNRTDVCSLKTSLFDDIIKNKSDCTIVIKTIENKLPALNVLSGNNSVLSLVDSTQSKVGIFSQRQTGATGRFRLEVRDSAGTAKSILKTVSDSVFQHNYVLSYGDNGNSMTVGRNGEVDVRDAAYYLNPDKLIIGSPNEFLTGASLNGIVTQILVYPYKMTVAQVESLSSL